MQLPMSAGTITFNIKTREVLMVKQQSPSTGKVYWSFPKGHIEEKEKPKVAAVRETREETGIEPILIRKVFEEEIYRVYRNVKFHKIVILYAAYTAEYNTTPQLEEVLDARFIPLDIALFQLRQHEVEYVPALIKSFIIFSNKYKQLYTI